MPTMHPVLAKDAFICDMDGVIYHGNHLLPGVQRFVRWLQESGKRYLFLTNSSERTPRELAQKLARLGVDVPPERFHTSALATATFLASQSPGCGVYAIGDAGLLNALYDAGLSMNEVNPEYVVVGESTRYTYDTLIRAIRLVVGGARLIGTNPDLTGPTEGGLVPACGSLVAPIELATGCKAYYLGKPNPLMMRHALKRLGATREQSAIIGDRMDTDIIAGIESEIETVLVLTGVTRREDLVRFPYRPNHICSGIAELADSLPA
jgi:NagD protein